jgi:hypothetical protein
MKKLSFSTPIYSDDRHVTVSAGKVWNFNKDNISSDFMASLKDKVVLITVELTR